MSPRGSSRNKRIILAHAIGCCHPTKRGPSAGSPLRGDDNRGSSVKSIDAVVSLSGPKMMFSLVRKTIGWLLPVCLLAIVLQIMLPLAMIKALVVEADPLNRAVICHSAPTDDTSTDGSSRLPRSSHDCACPVCHVGGNKQIALTVAQVRIPVPSQVAELSVLDRAQSTGPRGPPLDRPRARSPPFVG